MSLPPVGSTAYGTQLNTANLDQLDRDLEQMRARGIPDAEAKALLAQMRALGLYQEFGTGTGSVDALTMQGWQSLLSGDTSRFRIPGKTAEETQAMLKDLKGKIDDALARLPDALSNLQQGIESLKAMKQLLESGDISGAVMLLQTTRASGLDAQLRTQVTAMQNRNVHIQTLNSQLATEQGKNPRNEAEITRINAAIQKANGDSQLQMIEIQDLVNKRNQAYDMLSNLLNKFQKTLDGIVSNMR